MGAMTNPKGFQPVKLPANMMLDIASCEKALTNSGRFLVKRIIGRGTFGVVFEVKNSSDLQDMAVKVVRISSEGEERLWPFLRSRYVVPLFESFLLSSAYIAYVMPFIGKDLYELIYKTDFDEHRDSFYRKKKYSRDILRGLQYLHCRNLVHRDLKEENVVVCQNTDVAMIGDFTTLAQVSFPDKFDFGLSRCCLPPEVASESRVCEYFDAMPAEMWTYGIMILQLYTKQGVIRYCNTMVSYDNEALPFIKSMLELENMKKIFRSLYPRLDIMEWEVMELVGFLKQFLLDNPLLRSSALHAQWHSFVSDVKESKACHKNTTTKCLTQTHGNSTTDGIKNTQRKLCGGLAQIQETNYVMHLRELVEARLLTPMNWWKPFEIGYCDLNEASGVFSSLRDTFERGDMNVNALFNVMPRNNRKSEKEIEKELLASEDLELLVFGSSTNKPSVEELGRLHQTYREKYKHMSAGERTRDLSTVIQMDCASNVITACTPEMKVSVHGECSDSSYSNFVGNNVVPDEREEVSDTTHSFSSFVHQTDPSGNRKAILDQLGARASPSGEPVTEESDTGRNFITGDFPEQINCQSGSRRNSHSSKNLSFASGQCSTPIERHFEPLPMADIYDVIEATELNALASNSEGFLFGDVEKIVRHKSPDNHTKEIQSDHAFRESSKSEIDRNDAASCCPGTVTVGDRRAVSSSGSTDGNAGTLNSLTENLPSQTQTCRLSCSSSSRSLIFRINTKYTPPFAAASSSPAKPLDAKSDSKANRSISSPIFEYRGPLWHIPPPPVQTKRGVPACNAITQQQQQRKKVCNTWSNSRMHFRPRGEFSRHDQLPQYGYKRTNTFILEMNAESYDGSKTWPRSWIKYKKDASRLSKAWRLVRRVFKEKCFTYHEIDYQPLRNMIASFTESETPLIEPAVKQGNIRNSKRWFSR